MQTAEQRAGDLGTMLRVASAQEETTQTNVNGQRRNQNVEDPHNGILFHYSIMLFRGKEGNSDMLRRGWTGGRDTKGNKPVTEDCTSHGSIPMEHPEQGNPHRQQGQCFVQGWSGPGRTGEEGECGGSRVSLGSKGSVPMVTAVMAAHIHEHATPAELYTVNGRIV